MADLEEACALTPSQFHSAEDLQPWLLPASTAVHNTAFAHFTSHHIASDSALRVTMHILLMILLYCIFKTVFQSGCCSIH